MDQFPISQGVQNFLENTGSRYVHRLDNAVNDSRFPITRVTPTNLGYMQFPQEIMKDSPVAFYRLNANANDTTTNVLHGTASNVTFGSTSLLTYPQGGVPITSGSGSFTAASTSNITLPTSALLNITGDITLEAWIKTSLTTAELVIGGYSLTTGYGLGVNMVTAGKFGYYRNGTWYESTTSVNDNTRHQIAIVGTSGSIKMYLDGNLHRTVAATSGQPTSYAGTRKIGSVIAGGSYFTGNIEEVTIWNTALLDADILIHWQAGTATQVAV
jgi:hypothetical protein